MANWNQTTVEVIPEAVELQQQQYQSDEEAKKDSWMSFGDLDADFTPDGPWHGTTLVDVWPEEVIVSNFQGGIIEDKFAAE